MEKHNKNAAASLSWQPSISIKQQQKPKSRRFDISDARDRRCTCRGTCAEKCMSVVVCKRALLIHSHSRRTTHNTTVGIYIPILCFQFIICSLFACELNRSSVSLSAFAFVSFVVDIFCMLGFDMVLDLASIFQRIVIRM